MITLTILVILFIAFVVMNIFSIIAAADVIIGVLVIWFVIKKLFLKPKRNEK